MKRTKEELLLYIARLEALIDNLPFDTWYKDKDGIYLVVNQSCGNYAGKTKEEIVGRNDYEIYPKEEAELYLASDRATIEGKMQNYYESEDQRGKYKEEFKKPVFDDEGSIIGVTGFSRDITKIKKTHDALKQSEERFRMIFEQAPLGIGIFDSTNGMAYQVNNRFAEILGRSKEELENLEWISYSHPDEIEENLYRMKLLKDHQTDGFSMNKRFIRGDGSVVWANMTIAPFEPEGFNYSRHLCMIEDITARKKAEEEILYLSYYDQLTGLYNRRFYEEELKRLDTERNLPITLIMADLNGLKLTNDAFGHLAGDKLLKRVADIIKQECRSDDIIARTGGDEFVLLLPRTDSKQAEMIIQRINQAVSNEKVNHIICSVSFGWETKTEVHEDIRKVYMHAEDQMYRHKLSESTSMRNETIKVITKTLYQKNEREQLHCERVSELCKAIGQAMGMSKDSVNELKTAGLLHDIGKIGIDEKLLNKHGGLTETERMDLKRHPEIGYHILRSVNEFAPIAEYVLYHHERIDGKGYPGKLTGDKIPMQSKIISIADAFDAMTSNRTYRKDLSETAALEEIRKHAGTQFDLDIAKTFIEKVLGIEFFI